MALGTAVQSSYGSVEIEAVGLKNAEILIVTSHGSEPT
jgi:hypothetical protein